MSEVKRRKMGTTLSGPINELYDVDDLDTLIFIEEDNEAASKTRAAALMFIGRNNLGLKTKVRENEIWIMKDKDYIGNCITEDLRV